MATTEVPSLVVNPNQRSVELPAEAPRPDPTPGSFSAIHTTAARMDGMVKMLIGLVLVVFSLGSVVAGAVGLHALIRLQEVRLIALVLGLPGLLLALTGVVMFVMGVWKALSGRGRG